MVPMRASVIDVGQKRGPERAGRGHAGRASVSRCAVRHCPSPRCIPPSGTCVPDGDTVLQASRSQGQLAHSPGETAKLKLKLASVVTAVKPVASYRAPPTACFVSQGEERGRGAIVIVARA